MENLETIETLEPLEPIYELLEMLIARYGSLGIFAAMFAESAGVPFASALVLLTSGTMILRGSVSFWSLFIASTIGITIGSMFSYCLGMFGGMVGRVVKNNYGHLVHFQPLGRPGRGLSRISLLWDRYGNFSIFMAQLWGVSRTFISFPAGAMNMKFPLFVGYTFFGGAIFSLLYIGLSIAITRAMSLIINTIRLLADFSPWLLSIPILVALLMLYLIISRRWKPRLPDSGKAWAMVRARFKKRAGE